MYSILDLSEIIFGLVVENEILPNAVNIKYLEQPYKDGIKYILDGNKKSREQIISNVGIPAFQSAMDAYESVKSIKNVNWIELLEKASFSLKLSGQLRKAADKIENGEEYDFGDLVQTFNIIEGKQHNGVRLIDVKTVETPFQPSGWEAIDTHLMGYPKQGLITIGAAPFTGKTSFMLQANARFLRAHPDKIGVLFSLEMPAEELKARCMNFGSLYSDDVMERTIIYDLLFDVKDVSYTAYKHKDEIGFMGVDFADLMLKNEASEGEMGNIYITLSITAKMLGIPLMLLSQLSRSYSGGTPRPHHLRYTSMAEAVSWGILMLYNPWTSFYSSKAEGLPDEEGYSYIVAWKYRGGFRLHNNQPGAIRIKFEGERGWHPRADFSDWRMLVR
jgi:hypothetical protein